MCSQTHEFLLIFLSHSVFKNHAKQHGADRFLKMSVTLRDLSLSVTVKLQ